MLEAELQANVIHTARLLGWRVAHFRPAQTAKGWRTPVEADGAGFPDLVMVRGDRLLVVELKSTRGTVSAFQAEWLERLEGTCAEVYVWRPRHWVDGTIEEVLRRAA
jgi:hypothetical protein